MTLTDKIISSAASIILSKLSKIDFGVIQRPTRQLLYNLSKKYVSYYVKKYCQIQVLGMSVPYQLNDIYINVLLLNPEFLNSIDTIHNLEDKYRTSKKRNFIDYDLPKQNGIDVANTDQFLCVLGGPGVGKTTYLKKIGLESLLRIEGGSYSHDKIPVFIDLKNISNNDFELETTISEEFKICGYPNPVEFTKKALQSGDLLILLDGLDEVPTTYLKDIIKLINDFSVTYSLNRFMVSCRTAAYRTYLTGFKTVMVAEFDNDQIYNFMRNWFYADPNPNLTPELKEKNVNECWRQINDINSLGTVELSHTPLLLTFICLVFSRTKRINENRSTLYSKALDILLDEWAKEKCLEENWEEYQKTLMNLEISMLSMIAYMSFVEDKFFFSKDELLKEISEFLNNNLNKEITLDVSSILDAIAIQQGIFVERAPNIYSFSHLTLQEYLCAVYIRDWNKQDILLRKYSLDEKWQEIFFLVVGLMDIASINFLELFNQQAQLVAHNNKIEKILIWSNRISEQSENQLSNEINRLYLIILVICIYSAIMLDSSFVCEINGVLSTKITTTSTLSSALDLSLFLLKNLDDNYELYSQISIDYPQEIPSFNAKIIDIDRILLIIKIVIDLGIFSSEKVKAVNDLFALYFSTGKHFTSVVVNPLCSILGISIDLFCLSENELQILIDYLSTYRLMIRCNEQSGIPSHNEAWVHIQKDMFIPSDSVSPM